MTMTIEIPKVREDARLTAKQAADVLMVSKRSVLNWITSGKLKATLNVKKEYRISGREILKLWRSY